MGSPLSSVGSEEDTADILIDPYKTIVIHEVVEYSLHDLVDLVLAGTRAAGGTTIPILQWANGVVFHVEPLYPESDVVIEEQLKGVVHLSSVTFAVKEKFEEEVRTGQGLVRLLDVGATPNFHKLAETLKRRSRSKQVRNREN